MGKTIVQEYGPIYGEPVNGTVMGRPNGSVFVPDSNKASISLIEDYRYLKYVAYSPTYSVFRTCDSSGQEAIWDNSTQMVNGVALSQDLSSNLQFQIYKDSGLTAMVGFRDANAGIFNMAYRDIGAIDTTLEDGDTVYLRIQLMNNGTPIATSDVIEAEMVIA